MRLTLCVCMYASKRYTNWSPSLQTGFGGVGKDFLHPAVLQLGLRYAEGSIVGGTKRTLALMTTLKTVIDELVEEGSDAQLRTLLKQVVDKNVQFLVACRPLAVGMGNAIREFKNEIERFHKTSPNATFDFAKNHFKRICSAYAAAPFLQYVFVTFGQVREGEVLIGSGGHRVLRLQQDQRWRRDSHLRLLLRRGGNLPLCCRPAEQALSCCRYRLIPPV